MTSVHGIIGLCVLCQSVGTAARIQWLPVDGGDGQAYELVEVEGGITWTQARAAAEVAGGHLVTISSQSENDFVLHIVLSGNPGAWPHYHGPWLGGYQDLGAPDYAEPSGGWRWVTGEPWEFTSWLPGVEPNDSQEVEDYLCADDHGDGSWNDIAINGNQNGTVNWYIVEYPPCYGDVSRDALVDFDDLNLVLAAWGRSEGEIGFVPEADLDGSGQVDFTDLNEVLQYWGEVCD